MADYSAVTQALLKKGGGRPMDPLLDSFGTLTPTPVSPRERLADVISGLLGGSKEAYQGSMGLLGKSSAQTPEAQARDMMNPFGLLSAYDAGRDVGGALQKGDYGSAGLSLAMAFAPGPNIKKFRAFKGLHPYTDEGALVDLTKGREQHSWFSRENAPPTSRGNAGFFASNPEVASHFADLLSREGAVFPAEVSFNNPLVIDGGGRHAADFQFGKNNDLWQQYFTSPEYAGYDGVILSNVKDAGGVTDIYIPKDPEQIAHQFDRTKK